LGFVEGEMEGVFFVTGFAVLDVVKERWRGGFGVIL
jgi:hypothetical protein